MLAAIGAKPGAITPRAPGRTSRLAAAGPLPADEGPSLFFGQTATLSVLRAYISIILSSPGGGVKCRRGFCAKTQVEKACIFSYNGGIQQQEAAITMAGQDFLEDENDQTSDILSMQVQLFRGFMARHQLDKWAALKLFQ